MLINLNDVEFATVDGMRLELHFKDHSSHMRRFASTEEMLSQIQEWQDRTTELTKVRLPRLSDFSS